MAVGTPCSGGRSSLRATALLRGAGGCAGLLGGDVDEGTHLGVELVDAGQVVVDELDGRDLAAAHRGCLLEHASGHEAQS